MPRIMREHLRDKCSGGIGRDAATGSSKGAVLFFFGSYAGRRAGRLRIGYPATPAAGGRPHRGIRRHLPPDAARTGNPANDGMPKAGPDGPVRGNRSVGSGRYGWNGIRPAASRGTVGGGRPVIGGSHTTGSCGYPAGNLQMLPRKVQRPGQCRRLFAETRIRYPRRGRTTPLPETNPAPSETLPAEAECRRQGWRTGGPLARGFCPNQEILQSRRSSMP